MADFSNGALRKTPAASAAEHSKTLAAVGRVSGRIAGMLKNVPDTNVPIPDSEWTVGGAAVHLVATQTLFLEALGGTPSPYGDGRLDRFAAVNAAQLERSTERRGHVLAAQLEERTKELLSAISTYRETYVVEYHFGPMDMTEWMSYCLTHLYMHGCPMARALGEDEPIRNEEVPHCIPFLKAVMPRVFDREAAGRLKACFDFRLGPGKHIYGFVNRGSLTVSDRSPAAVDCHIAGEPAALLKVLTGIRSQWWAIPRGKIFTWGRRPWLALRVKRIFPNP